MFNCTRGVSSASINMVTIRFFSISGITIETHGRRVSRGRMVIMLNSLEETLFLFYIMALIVVLFLHSMTVTGIVLQIRSVLIPSSVCLLISSQVSITIFVAISSCLIFLRIRNTCI